MKRQGALAEGSNEGGHDEAPMAMVQKFSSRLSSQSSAFLPTYISFDMLR